jgi:hypothetical protein
MSASANRLPSGVNGGVADATAGRYLIFFFAGTAGIM